MCRIRLTCFLINQCLTVSVVGTDKHYTVHFLDCFNRLSDTLIHYLYSLYSCRFHCSMSDHIRVCKVDDYNIVLTALYSTYKLVTNLISTHLRLEVIGCHILRRIYKDSVLTLIRLFLTAVEEESNMCVLFSLCKS